ncbi:MAG: ABC transporter substrate-binding protein [Bacteroidaceae bacterium]
MNRKTLLILGIASLLFAACQQKVRKASLWIGTPINLEYSNLLHISQKEAITQIVIDNPWDSTAILDQYVLVPKKMELTDSLRKILPKGQVIRTPLTKAVVLSSVHAGLFLELHSLSAIAGVCDSEYMLNEQIQTNIKDGQIIDLGSGITPNIERMVEVKPDGILASPFQNSGGHGRIEQLGTPIIECADYMETSPLGRAEWIRFYGLLLGQEQLADSLFALTSERYEALSALAQTTKNRPTVFSGLKSSSAWYIAGGKSVTSGFFGDAAGNYIWHNNTSYGSIPMSFERVFEQAKNAAIWLFKYNTKNDLTYQLLKEEYTPYAGFAAYQNHRVYACNTGKVRYYDETPFHPELFLADIIRIFHPELKLEGKNHYFFPLK